MLDQAITFGPFRLDPGSGLTHGRRPVRLTPKALSLLCFLAAERGRVVGKEELFRAVWRGAAVGDAALVTCVQELRRALHDKASKPRYIETLHRRGYRFIAQADAVPAGSSEAPGFTGPDAALLVGRQVELGELERALETARAGKREVVLVAGEPGIGKTALVRGFFARAAPTSLVWGQSAEHYGSTEPYHPLLDALMRFCRSSAGERLLAALEMHAPLWLAQMPSLLTPAKRRALQQRIRGATRERMQREVTEALEAAARERPLVLWLEDLHWADAPTIDWLAAFARRPEPARMLVVGTYRPIDARAERHALFALGDELVRQGRSRILALGPLTAEAVEQYVAARFKPAPGEAEALARLARQVFERSEGSPLFLVGVLNELVSRSLLRQEGEGWSVAQAVNAPELGIPSVLRQVIERQIDRLPSASTALLEAASIAGLRFTAAVVAAAVERPIAEVESELSEISREHGLIVARAGEDWPDGTVSGGFSFAHALYREALAARVSAARAVGLHRRVGERLAAAYGERADELAAQLAMHFERAREFASAIGWLRKAGDAAARRKAAREAVLHYEHALELVERLPRGRAREETNAELRLALSAPLAAVHGLGSSRVEDCAAAAMAACAALGDAKGHFAAHRMLWNHSLMRHPVAPTLVHARQLMEQAQASASDVELALAHRALGSSLIYVGNHADAAAMLMQGVCIADRVDDTAFDRYGEHPGMVCRAFAAWPKAFMGLHEEAVALSDDSVRHARRRDEPHGLAFALVTAGLVDLFHRDVERADRIAHEVHALSQQYELPQWMAFALEIRGWVAFRSGERACGIDLMCQALERLHATGARTHSSRVLANLAESCLAAGRLGDARAYIRAALDHRAAHGEQYYAPELYRLNALILEREGASQNEVRACLDQALALARAHGAALFERRIILSSAPQAEPPRASARIPGG